MTVVTFFTLGSLREYKCVFYEVYCKHSDKEKPRKYVVATNLSPLATTVANLKEDPDKTFFIGVFMPVTLVTNVIAKQNKEGSNREPTEPLSEIQDMLERNPSELAKRLIEQLINKVNKGQRDANKYINEYVKKPEKFREVLMPSMSLTEPSEKPGSCSLPYVDITKAELTISTIDTDGKKTETYKGYLGIALMPLKGNYPVYGGSKREGSSNESNTEYRVIFQEDLGRKGVQDFISLTMASYLVATYKFLKHALNPSNKTPHNSHPSSLKLIIDTSIGLNSATVMMSQVISNALPLIYLEALRNNINAQDIDVLFYNSDPPPSEGSIDENKEEVPPELRLLELTEDNKVGYHYLDKSIRSSESLPMENIIAHVREYIRNECLNSKGNTDTCRLLEGVYLLRYGLVPWGLYHVLNAQNTDEIPEDIITIETEMKTEDKGKKLRVYYRPAAELTNKKVNAYVEGEVLWLAEVTQHYIGGAHNELCEKVHYQFNSRSKQIDLVCYSFDTLKNLIDSQSRQQGKLKVVGNFLSSIVNDVARIIFVVETEKWIGKPKSQARHMYPYNRIDKSKYLSCTLCGGSYSNCCCLEPEQIKGNGEEEVRNVVAHAGLTSVHEDMVFVLREIGQNQYEGVKVCIGKEFPKAKLERMLGR